jgi:CheY-like chemotaxis protein
MPEVSGFDVVAALREDPKTAAIPIVVVTAKHVTAADRAALSGAAGEAIAIVEKAAFNRQAFIAAVKRALMRPQRSADGENPDH